MEAELHITWMHVVTIVTTIGGYVLALVLIPRILLSRREAGATLAWIGIIALVPYLGALLFFVFGHTRVRRRTRKKMRARHFVVRSLQQLPDPEQVCDQETLQQKLPEQSREIARVATRLAETDLLAGNRVEVFINADRAYERMIEAIQSARQHIHLMSYIYRPDGTGARFRDALVEKARQGVEVRLLVDGFGGRPVGSKFIRPLLESGGQFARFMPMLRMSPHWRPNLRNHRKILVVDNRLGFAGGLNIGDEYRGRRQRFAPWRDTHMYLEGPAARRLQEVFAEDWHYATNEDLVDSGHFPLVESCGPELVQVVDSGPDHAQEVIRGVFFTAINEARYRVYITTPYFAPDPAILLALKAAAWRGVDVRLLLPGRSDMRLVQLAGRSFYRELLNAGIRIFEHRPGILHAKTMVIDGLWSTVGSANLDIRSFRLNFEANVIVFGESFAQRMEEIFQADLQGARIISLKEIRNKPMVTRVAEAVCRTLSPVL